MTKHTSPPGGPQPAGILTLMPYLQPEAFRAAIGDEIERLIATLDALDADPDLEENGDEHDQDLAGASSNREMDTSDDEPSMGSFDRMANQENWSRVAANATWLDDGRELDNCDREDGGDREPDCDDEPGGDEEPSLGSPEDAIDHQLGWARGGVYDLEVSCIVTGPDGVL